MCELCVIGVIVCVYLIGKPPWPWPRLVILTMTYVCVCVCWPWPRLVIIDNKNIASMCVGVCVCFGLGLCWVDNSLCVLALARLVIIDNIASMCLCFGLGLGWFSLTI